LAYWVGLRVWAALPGLADDLDLLAGPHPEVIPPYYKELVELMLEVASLEEVNTGHMELMRAKDIYKAFTLSPPTPKVEEKFPDLALENRLEQVGNTWCAWGSSGRGLHGSPQYTPATGQNAQVPTGTIPTVPQMWSRHRRHSSLLHSLPQSEARLEPAGHQGGPPEWRPRYKLETTDAELEVPT
jgi:hypothetical protein